MSRIAKLLLATGVAAGIVAYVVIVDLGVNAGRIHYGVSVEGVYVGGLTVPEAVDRLTERGKEIKGATVTFSVPGVNCYFLPRDVGWGPQPADTAKRAIEVGRAHAPFGALLDRIDAWLGGIQIGWAGAVKPPKVDRFLDECADNAMGQGLVVDRDRLRTAVARAIVTWPRPVSFRLPLERPAT